MVWSPKRKCCYSCNLLDLLNPAQITTKIFHLDNHNIFWIQPNLFPLRTRFKKRSWWQSLYISVKHKTAGFINPLPCCVPFHSTQNGRTFLAVQYHRIKSGSHSIDPQHWLYMLPHVTGERNTFTWMEPNTQDCFINGVSFILLSIWDSLLVVTFDSYSADIDSGGRWGGQRHFVAWGNKARCVPPFLIQYVCYQTPIILLSEVSAPFPGSKNTRTVH